MEPIALYVHVPFCRAKCGYCDFNSYPLAEVGALRSPYVDALLRELAQAGPAQVRTIYVGGGTPTVLPLSLLARLLGGVWAAFGVDDRAEVSLEANPGTVDHTLLAAVRALGVNRLSLGVQSLDAAELRLLGRIHTAKEAADALRAARSAGFDNVNLDLIYGLPGQALDTWQESLERALELAPEHLSLYALTLEEGTPLAAEVAAGRLPEPDPDLAADMYELAQERLAGAGYDHYELSNWARSPDFRCQHNLVYWRNDSYAGVGAGAHSWDGSRRWANVSRPAEYIARLQAGESPVDMQETIGTELEMGETMMLGLRLVEEGVAFDRFDRRFGRDLRRIYAAPLAELTALGLIELVPDRVRLSPRGRLLGNQAFMRFLPEEESARREK